MRTRPRRLLVGSLIVNALLIGIIVGHLLKMLETSPQSQPQPQAQAQQRNGQAFRATGEPNQQILLNLHAMHLQNRQLLMMIQEEKARAMEIVITEPFDEKAYQASIDKIHRLRGQAVQHVTDKVKKWVPGLSESDRAIVAEMLRHPPPPDITR